LFSERNLNIRLRFQSRKPVQKTLIHHKGEPLPARPESA